MNTPGDKVVRALELAAELRPGGTAGEDEPTAEEVDLVMRERLAELPEDRQRVLLACLAKGCWVVELVKRLHEVDYAEEATGLTEKEGSLGWSIAMGDMSDALADAVAPVARWARGLTDLLVR